MAPRIALPLLAAALLLLAASALAAAPPALSSSQTSIDDPQDGVAGHPDIQSADAGLTATNQLVHTITTFDQFDTSVAPCLDLRISHPSKQDYEICGDGNIVRASDSAVVGTATVDRPDTSSISYTFGRSAIQKASVYKWKVIVRAGDCPDGVCDVAPDTGWVVQERAVSYGHWADRFLDHIKAPGCHGNEIVMVAWETNEGTQAAWNPLATTYRMPGSTNFNSVGVQDYTSLSQGLEATWLTLQRGFDSYGYREIVTKLDHCAAPMRTARAIRRSEWCGGCSNGQYVTGLIKIVTSDYATYAARLVGNGSGTNSPQGSSPLPAPK